MFGALSAHFSFWWALSLVGLCLGILSAWIAAQYLKTGESFPDILMTTGAAWVILISQIIQAIKLRTLIKSVGMLILCVVCLVVGHFHGVYQERRARYTYTDVLIVARHTDKSFSLQPARMAVWETGQLCESVDWQQFQKMSRFTYSVKRLPDGNTCKDAERGGDYEFYTQHGKRLLFPPKEKTRDEQFGDSGRRPGGFRQAFERIRPDSETTGFRRQSSSTATTYSWQDSDLSLSARSHVR